MKKITDFIVNKRNFILVIFILLSIVSLIVSTKVNINYDMSEYLPKTSETRKGMDIMNEEFGTLDSSTLNVMFTDLKDDEKNTIKEKLEKIDHISEVEYDNTETYNKDNYTLYVITTDVEVDSKEATQVYEDVTTTFKDYTLTTSGDISERNKPVLHNWIIVLAICCAMIILIIMCDSYVEPFLFLFSIGLAVFMNMGTNIIFSSVSFITQAIAAILQLALSMDYSIMLMNRYEQERNKAATKEEAMKKALYNAFISISSSSITTIVGLLALVFMSFTIGKDLGFVLAKGVLFSLISIFLTLPALILLFDKLILKTKKKSLNIKTDWLGKTIYKIRIPEAILFIILFMASFLLKDGMNILYTGSENDEVGQVFTTNNQIAIIYKNEYEDKISTYCKNLTDENVKEVLCYGNTINEDLKYNEVNDKLKELGLDNQIDEYLLKIIYYEYYNKNNNTLTFDEFINFINNDLSDEIKEKIDSKTLKNLNKLSNFTTYKNINKTRTAKELSEILGIDESDINSIMVLYNSENPTNKLTLYNFITFVNEDVLTNKEYSKNISNDNKENLQLLSKFIDKEYNNKPLNKTELSKLFGLEESDVEKIILLYYQNNETNTKFTISDFVSSVIYIKENTNYLDNKDITQIYKLNEIIKNKAYYNQTLNKTYLNQVFYNIDSSLVNNVYALGEAYGLLTESSTFTPIEFLDFTLKYGTLDDETKANLETIRFVMYESNANNKYSDEEISKLFSLELSDTYKIFALINYINKTDLKVSPYNFVCTILDNQSLINLDKDKLSTLKLLKQIMISINNNTKYDYKEISNLLGIDKSKTKLIYSLYKTNSSNTKISLLDFTNYILENVITNDEYKDKFTDEDIEKLESVNKIMKNYQTKYTYSEMYNILVNLNKDISKDQISLVFTYKGSKNSYDESWTMTLETLVNYLNDDILNNTKYSDFISDDKKEQIINSKKDIDDAKELLVGKNYSRAIFNTNYKVESSSTMKFIENIQKELNDDGIYVIGNSPMALDMSKSFNSELNFITILTMIAIFVVVAISFKSLVIPTILVLTIQCAVFITMSVLSLTHANVYFISLLIVQSILMGATIDYGIVYTSYYLEARKKKDIKESILYAYKNSIHTILTSSLVLMIVTLIVGNFASQIAAKICMTISEGTFVSVILILFILPSLITIFDKVITKKR